MNCQEFWKSDNPERSGHLEECAACAAAWSRQRAVAAGLHTIAAEWRSVEAPDRLESRLVAAFHEHAGWAAPRFRPHWAPVVTGFSAAAALVLAALLLVRSPEQPRPARRAAPSTIQLANVEPPLELDES